MLRERSGLSTEELAARAGVPAEDITELEAGGSDVALDIIRRVALACDHGAAVALWGQLEDDEQRWIRHELHLLITRLLVASDVTSETALSADDLGTTAYVLLGLLGASRELIRALLILDAVGQSLLAAANLVRQTFDNVATAHWILEDSGARAVRLYQETNRQLREMGRIDDHWEAIHQERRGLWAGWGIPEDEFTERLPGFEQRLIGPMKEENWYIRYRELSNHSHPTLFVVEDALQGGPLVRYRAEAHCPLDWFAMAGVLVWSLAIRLQRYAEDARLPALGYTEDRQRFAEIGDMMNRFTNEEGMQALRAAYRARGEQDGARADEGG